MKQIHGVAGYKLIQSAALGSFRSISAHFGGVSVLFFCMAATISLFVVEKTVVKQVQAHQF